MWQSDRCGVLEALVRRTRHQQLGSRDTGWVFLALAWLGFTHNVDIGEDSTGPPTKVITDNYWILFDIIERLGETGRVSLHLHGQVT